MVLCIEMIRRVEEILRGHTIHLNNGTMNFAIQGWGQGAPSGTLEKNTGEKAGLNI